VSCSNTAELTEMPFGMWTPVCARKHVLDGCADWPHLANTTEPSVGVRVRRCSLMPNYFDHLLCQFLVCLQFFAGEVILRNLVLKDNALVSAFSIDIPSNLKNFLK